MPLRFRKSVKIAPGVKVNFNKKSTSISVGGKHVGITANSHRGVTGRISAPGTGLTYTTKLTGSSRSSRSSNSRRSSRSYDYSSVDFDSYDSDVLFSSSESASQSGSRPQYPTTPKSPPPAPVKPSPPNGTDFHYPLHFSGDSLFCLPALGLGTSSCFFHSVQYFFYF